jgi:hypothetical protein
MFLQIKSFVYGQIRTPNLQIRMTMNNESQKIKRNTCFPRTSILANAAQIIQW